MGTGELTTGCNQHPIPGGGGREGGSRSTPSRFMLRKTALKGSGSDGPLGSYKYFTLPFFTSVLSTQMFKYSKLMLGGNPAMD